MLIETRFETRSN